MGKTPPTDAWGPSTGTAVSPLPATATSVSMPQGSFAPATSYSGDGTSFTTVQPQSVTINVHSYGGIDYTTTQLNAPWNNIKSIQVASTSWDASFDSRLAYDNYVPATIDLRAAGQTNLDVLAVGEKRGRVTLGNGNDNFTWVAASNGCAQADNTMAVYAGDGDDTITAAGLNTFDDDHNSGNGNLWIPGYRGGGSTAELHLDVGSDTVTVIGAFRSFISGFRPCVVICGSGADTIDIGAGKGDFTGGGGADLFVISQGSGHGVVNDVIPGTNKLDFKGMTSR